MINESVYNRSIWQRVGRSGQRSPNLTLQHLSDDSTKASRNAHGGTHHLDLQLILPLSFAFFSRFFRVPRPKGPRICHLVPAPRVSSPDNRARPSSRSSLLFFLPFRPTKPRSKSSSTIVDTRAIEIVLSKDEDARIYSKTSLSSRRDLTRTRRRKGGYLAGNRRGLI